MIIKKVLIINLIIYTKIKLDLLIGNQLYLNILYKYRFNLLFINKLKCKEIIKLHLRNVNIKQLLQNQNGGILNND